MTARATITDAAMRRAIDAVKQGVRVIIEPSGRVILERETQPGQDDPQSAYEAWRSKRGAGQS